MAGKKSFSVHADFFDEVNILGDEQSGKLFKALIKWAMGAELPELDIGCSILFRLMVSQQERLSESRSAAGSKGGGQLGNQNASKVTIEQNEQIQQNEPTITKTRTVPKTNLNIAVIGAREAENEGGENADANFAKAMSHYMETIGTMPPSMVSAGIQGYLDHMELDVIVDAIDRAAANNQRNWSYINGILSNRKSAGVKNMADVARQDEEHNANKSARGGSRNREPPQTCAEKFGSATQDEVERMEQLLRKIKES